MLQWKFLVVGVFQVEVGLLFVVDVIDDVFVEEDLVVVVVGGWLEEVSFLQFYLVW